MQNKLCPSPESGNSGILPKRILSLSRHFNTTFSWKTDWNRSYANIRFPWTWTKL